MHKGHQNTEAFGPTCSTYYPLNSIQVNQLVLAEGEDKLRRLVQQKKFVEAESYALDNGLNVEVNGNWIIVCALCY